MKSLRVAAAPAPFLLLAFLVLSLSSAGAAEAALPWSWDDRFGLPGTDGPVFGAVWFQGELYIGGSFTEAGGVRARGLARWDGRRWWEVGGGVRTPNVGALVRALHVHDGRLIVGGFFTQAGEVGALNIAAWDGDSWSALGSGAGNTVYALASWNGDVVAGGGFSTAGGQTVRRVARWDGGQWHAMGDGFESQTAVEPVVRTLLQDGADLYAAGDFDLSGIEPVRGVARWSGTTWESLGDGLEGDVRALAVQDTFLLAGGNFVQTPSGPANRLARWTGVQWEALPAGGADGPVFALRRDGDDVLVGGEFSTLGAVTAVAVGRYDGTAFSPVAGGVTNRVWDLWLGPASEIIAVGEFGFTGDGGGSNVAVRRPGQPWDALGLGVQGEVRAAVPLHGGLYVGGEFRLAGGEAVEAIAFWDGVDWSPVGTGIPGGRVLAMAARGNQLVVAGQFALAGGVVSPNVALWDGGEWLAMSGGTDGTVTSVAVTEDLTVYVTGGFFNAGGQSIRHVAGWDGTDWFSLAGGPDSPGDARIVLADGNDLYMGGSFATVNEIEALNIARWSEGAWSGLGLGTNGPVKLLARDGAALYVAGNFTDAGGFDSEGLSIYDLDQSAWSTVEAGFDTAGVNVMLAENDSLWVGGSFTLIGTVPATSFAVWDGLGWNAINPEFETGTVRTLARFGESLAVGGSFARAGGGPGYNFSLGGPAGVTPVRVRGLGGTRTERGVELVWETDPAAPDLLPYREAAGLRVPVDAPVTRVRGRSRVLDTEAPSDALVYWLLDVDRSGARAWHGPVAVADAPAPRPTLAQNLPNPFRGSTRIVFRLPREEPVEVTLFDMAGRLVRRYTPGRLPAGEHAWSWDGLDSHGRRTAAGIYTYRLRAGSSEVTRKLVRLP